jgi:Protein of unknown function (DUF2752)
MSYGSSSRAGSDGDLGTRLLLAGVMPFVIARFFFTADAEPRRGAPRWHCPIKAITGVPCPGCGGTRAFARVTRGHRLDPRYENIVWPAASLAAIAGAVIVHSNPPENSHWFERTLRNHSRPALALLGTLAWGNAVMIERIRGSELRAMVSKASTGP